MASETIDPGALAEAVVAGDRTAVGRALTLVESTRPDHRRLTEDLLTRLLPHAGRSHRVGVTGVPGVGKSTFIEAVGSRLTDRGHRVAVLAVDPSSSRSGGSILGDKTRMARLAADPRAFIRPSPSSGTLGGVTRATRESIIVLEAAGHDVVIVETVGVGQSETIVAGMVDTYLVLMLAGAGDELQGIKKGILELADVVAVNKADGENVTAARLAAAEYRRALELLAPTTPAWRPRVVTCSALTGEGLDEVWALVEEHRLALEAAGEFTARRRRQQLEWMRALLVERLLERALADPRVARLRTELEEAVAEGRLTPVAAVDALMAELDGGTDRPV